MPRKDDPPKNQDDQKKKGLIEKALRNLMPDQWLEWKLLMGAGRGTVSGIKNFGAAVDRKTFRGRAKRLEESNRERRDEWLNLIEEIAPEYRDFSENQALAFNELPYDPSTHYRYLRDRQFILGAVLDGAHSGVPENELSGLEREIAALRTGVFPYGNPEGLEGPPIEAALYGHRPFRGLVNPPLHHTGMWTAHTARSRTDWADEGTPYNYREAEERKEERKQITNAIRDALEDRAERIQASRYPPEPTESEKSANVYRTQRRLNASR